LYISRHLISRKGPKTKISSAKICTLKLYENAHGLLVIIILWDILISYFKGHTSWIGNGYRIIWRDISGSGHFG